MSLNANTMETAADWVMAITRLPSPKPLRHPKLSLSPWFTVWKDEGTAVSRIMLEPAAVISSTHVSVITFANAEVCSPRVSLVRHLRALREAAIAEGMQLLSWDEVLDEVKRRRGETVDEENTNLP